MIRTLGRLIFSTSCTNAIRLWSNPPRSSLSTIYERNSRMRSEADEKHWLISILDLSVDMKSVLPFVAVFLLLASETSSCKWLHCSCDPLDARCVCLDRGDFMTSVRDGYSRYDPDSTLNGFLPFWGIVLFIISCKSPCSTETLDTPIFVLVVFLLIAGLGLVGYLVGCRSPPDSLRQELDPATFYAWSSFAM